MKFNHPKLKEFKYLGVLGKGAQGKVIKVKDPRGRRVYALKKLNEDVDVEFVKNEINILQRFNHSNIVQVYDSNFDPKEGEFYILMQYMRHGSIIDYLSKNPISISKKMLFIEDVVKALTYMHSNDFLHRDIKPQNILITDDGDGAYACLGDFGITKAIAKDTETGMIVGSKSYLPLEVLRGEEKHTKQSDLYGLGMSMYEIFSGKHPINNFVKYIQELTNPEPFLPPSYHNKELSKEIDKFCLRAIAKKKEERFETIEEFCEQLNQCISLYDAEISTNTEQEEDMSSNEEILSNNIKGSLVSRNPIVETDSDTMSVEDLCSVGQNYFLGTNSYMQNKEKGIEYYEKAAKKGSSYAMNKLGYFYKIGDGVKKDFHEAVKWYRKSVELGDSKAAGMLGIMYRYSQVEQDK